MTSQTELANTTRAPAETPIETSAADETTVAAYLDAHPDFFLRHEALLESLTLPHAAGGAVSLVERQLVLLRARNQELQHKLMELVQVARENERLSQRFHHLALGLMEADSLDAVLATAQEQLRHEFGADHVVIRLLRREGIDGMHGVAADDPGLAAFEPLFESHRPTCGRLVAEQTVWLFGADADPEVASAVAVPLIDGSRRMGMLALGSRDADRFHPGMGTLFLGYLGDLVSRAVSLRLGG